MYSIKKRIYVTEKKECRGRKKNIDLNKHLARTSCNNCIRNELAMSDNEEDKEQLKKTHGRKTYVEKAIELDMFDEITEGIIDFSMINPFFKERELMEFCVQSYPAVFGDYKSYPQNFYKIIEKVDEWFTPLRNARALSKNNILRELYKDAFTTEMKHKDKINLVYLMHDIELWELEQKNNSSNNISEETSNTLDAIEQGLKELGGDNNG